MGLLDDAIREHLDLKRRRGADPAEVERAARDALGPVRRAPTEVESDRQLERGQMPAFDHELEDDQAGAYDHELEDGREGAYDDELGTGREGAYDHEFGDDQEATRVHQLEPLEEDAEPSRTLPSPQPVSEQPAPWGSSMSQDHLDSAEPHTARAPADPGDAVPMPEPPDEEPPDEEPPMTRRPGSGDLAREATKYDIGGAPRKEPTEEGEHRIREDRDQGLRREGEDVLEETPEFLQDAPEHDRLWFEQRPPRDFDFDG